MAKPDIGVSLNSYSDIKVEALFNNVFDIAEDLGKVVYFSDGDFDALLAESEGYGEWGVLGNEDGTRSLWFLIDSGTLILHADGGSEMMLEGDDSEWFQEKGEDSYDWFYRIISELIESEDLMDKIEDFSKDVNNDDESEEDDDGDFE